MDLKTLIPDAILRWLTANPFFEGLLIAVGVLMLAIIAHQITIRYIVGLISVFVRRTSSTIDDILLNRGVLSRLAWVAPMLVLYNFAWLVPGAEAGIHRFSGVIIIIILLASFGALLHSAGDIYQSRSEIQGRPIKGYIQTVNLLLYLFGFVLALGVIMQESPWTLISGLGALTAVVVLVFRDAVLNFIASITISANDLVRVGDWVETSKFSADGIVISIALYTVKIQNFDNTITIVPTFRLLDESFKNWRGMQESGMRRIKRSIFIDPSTVGFLDEATMDRFAKIPNIKEYMARKREEVERTNHNQGLTDDLAHFNHGLTNIGTFRIYLETWLNSEARLIKDPPIVVRLLQPTNMGLPIEVVAFVDTTILKAYEEVQSDIFDHAVAIVPEFGLRLSKIGAPPQGESSVG
jgi:miniconductance mechanosensitive channel